ncbi:MAG: YitT family protein [Clostridia bacterium]|nr:YitT family protein [Clostridia bacterium]
MEKKEKIKRIFIEYSIMTVATVVMACGIYFFKFPNDFVMGGVSGISMILGKIQNVISPATAMLIINVLLLIVGFIIFGKGFSAKTVWCSLVLSLTLELLEKLVPMNESLTGDTMLELVFAVALPAVGSAVVFNLGGTTGGTDIVAMVLRKYTPINIGVALFFVDVAIVIGGFFVNGIRTGLYSLVGLLIKALVIDVVIENINISKYFFIVTTNPDEVCKYINEKLHKGATIWKATGSYTKEDKTVILAVMTRSQAVALRNHIRDIDKNAFVIISSTSDIVGKGFRNTVE